MKKFLFILFLGLVGGGIIWLSKSTGIILDPKSNKGNETNDVKSLKTFGFLPTWMVGKTKLYGNELDYLIFLGIEVDKLGDLIWDVQGKKIYSDEFLKQKENIERTGGKNILGIRLFEDESLDELLSDSGARKKLISQVKEVVDEEDFDGVNLDFEYQGDPRAILGENFLVFLDELGQARVGEISVDVFVNTINKGSQSELETLLSKIDQLIIMAYDFHRPGVDTTGAVAPIGAQTGERSILEATEKIGEIGLDRNKIVMAYPLYGYEWKTYTSDFGAAIKRGWYQLATWKRMVELIKEKNLEVKWDELSMSPWVNFEENQENHQIYFENKESLERKLELAKNNQFLGVGFWALGYEGEDKVF